MENLSQGKENMLRPEKEALVLEIEKPLYLDDEKSLFSEKEKALVLEQEEVLVPDKDKVLVLEDENPLETELCLTNKASSEAYCESSPSNGSQLETSPSSTIVGSVSNDDNSQLETPPSSSAIAPVSSSAGDDPVKKALYKFGQRTSKYRGVTRHRWTGKYEAHLWDNTTISETRKRKGKQVYLGGYETEEKAAVAYDLAALKFWGTSGHSKLNFPVTRYEKEVEEMQDMSREEYINSLRRQSICFARGNSNYRGVTRQHEGRRWQARIGRVAGGRDIYLGTYDTEEEAAEAYDIAAVKLRGMNAITNFHISNYYKEGSKELDILPIKAEEERPPPPTVTVRRFRMSTT